MSDERITELETRVSHHELGLQQLSDVMIEQQKEIRGLERQIAMLEARLENVVDSTGTDSPEEEKPPHY